MISACTEVSTQVEKRTRTGTGLATQGRDKACLVSTIGIFRL